MDEVPPIAEFSRSQGIGYTMLADPKGAINERLGIRDTQYPVGSAAFGVPRPTLYILDSSGRIRLRYQEPTFRTRPDLDAVIRDTGKLTHPAAWAYQAHDCPSATLCEIRGRGRLLP